MNAKGEECWSEKWSDDEGEEGGDKQPLTSSNPVSKPTPPAEEAPPLRVNSAPVPKKEPAKAAATSKVAAKVSQW